LFEAEGLVPWTWLPHEDAGHTGESAREIQELLDTQTAFDTPKPVRLLEHLIRIATLPDSIVLDSFAGSGTTGHAVLKLNSLDNGSRKVVLVELDDSICTNVTRRRLEKVSQGYQSSRGESIAPLGSGFRYCKLGRTLLDEFGDINGDVTFTDLARYVYLLETGVPIPRRPKKDCPLLGVHQGRAIYLLYNGVLGDRRPAGGNVLTNSVLTGLPAHPDGKGSRVIFGEATRLSESTLARENIVFRQIPYSLRES
jgi:site-specific DNA-methyltransferase (adenine-specific)/adenine-specific DNA-methyltransferase